MLQVVKRFSQVLAVDHAISRSSRERSMLLLARIVLGKVLSCAFCGFYTADSGTIRINGETVKMTDPGVAIAHGIRMVHQSLCWFPGLIFR